MAATEESFLISGLTSFSNNRNKSNGCNVGQGDHWRSSRLQADVLFGASQVHSGCRKRSATYNFFTHKTITCTSTMWLNHIALNACSPSKATLSNPKGETYITGMCEVITTPSIANYNQVEIKDQIHTPHSILLIPMTLVRVLTHLANRDALHRKCCLWQYNLVGLRWDILHHTDWMRQSWSIFTNNKNKPYVKLNK